MIETRPTVAGSYKGFIYFRSEEEANEISTKLGKALSACPLQNQKLLIKRGCSEFAIRYPEFAINKSAAAQFETPSEWSRAEKDFDASNEKSQPPTSPL